jgi:predicted outer membrane repeat protein
MMSMIRNVCCLYPKTLLAATLAAVALCSASASAQTVVTACGTDDAPGGMNLATALTIGGDIVIRCSTGGTTIAFNDAHVLRLATTIDGEGRVTLDGGGDLPMFIVHDASVKLVLRQMTVQRGLNPFLNHPGSDAPSGGIVSSRGAVELWSVRTRDSKEPYDVRTLRAVERSTFEDNTGEFVVRAHEASFVESTLRDNAGSPLAQSRQRIDSRPRASIERSEIFGNGRPIVWFGDLILSRSRFTNNGSPQMDGGAVLMLDGTMTVTRTDFINNRGSSGGAIAVLGGKLDVHRATLEGNEARQRGGALWVNSGSTGFIDVRLRYAKFRNNRAQDGGAIALEGRLEAGAVLFSGNSASRFGGGIDVPRGVVEISRGTFVDNSAGEAGGAIRSGPTGHDQVRLGNALIVRNMAPAGGAFHGRTLDIANGSVVANQGGLEVVPNALGNPPGGITLRNSLLSQNSGGNCVGETSAVTDAGQNLQFPDTGCGLSIPVADPVLDSMFVPRLDSPARFSGDTETCMAHLLVAGRDVYGSERPAHDKCTIGAVEHDLERHAVRLLSRRRELPDRIREFFAFIGVGVIRGHD